MYPAKLLVGGTQAPNLQLTCPKRAETGTITFSHLLFRSLHHEYLQTYSVLSSRC